MKTWIVLTLSSLTLSSAVFAEQQNKPSPNSPCSTYYNAGHYEEALKVCEKEAHEGKKESQTTLGLMNFFGQGVVPSATTAAGWFHKAALQNDPLAQFHLGRLYSAGLGVEQNDQEAFKWYSAAAQQNLWQAQLMVSLAYRIGRGAPQDMEKAFEFYQAGMKNNMPLAKAKTQEDFHSQTALFNPQTPGHDLYLRGLDYLLGLKDKADPSQAFTWFEQAADLGHPNAQFQLGLMYLDGAFVDKDDEASYNWFFKAQESGHLEAAAYLAWMTLLGLGTPFDDDTAIVWYDKSLQAPKKVQTTVVKEEDEFKTGSFGWYLEAARKGDAKAMHTVGMLYYEGKGVVTDKAQAYRWLLEAAKNGNQEAQYHLGMMLLYGDGIIANPNEGLEWLKKAAQNNQGRAQYELGMMYYKGKPIEKNMSMAYAWLNLAASQDVIQAEAARNLIATEMTDEEISESQKISRELYEAMMK